MGLASSRLDMRSPLAPCVLAATLCVSTAASGGPCDTEPLAEIGGKKVERPRGETAFVFHGGLAIDADGAPNAYHPEDRGIDHLANAGRPGNWWAVVTDDRSSKGTPIVQ